MIYTYNQFSVSQTCNAICCKYVGHNFIAVGNSSGSIMMYLSGNLQKESVYVSDDGIKCEPTVTAIAPLQKTFFFCSYVNGIIKKWDIETKSCILNITESPGTTGFILTKDERCIITTNYDTKLRLYDAKTGKFLFCFRDRFLSTKNQGHNSRVHAVRSNPRRKNEFVSGGWDNLLHYWDIRKIHSINYYKGPHICSGDGLDISPNGDMVLTAEYKRNNSAKIRYYGTPEDTAKCLLKGQQKMYCGKFLNQNFVALGGTTPCKLYVLNHSTKEMIISLKLPNEGIYAIDSELLGTNYDPESLHTKIAMLNGGTLTELTFNYSPNSAY